MQIGIFNSIVLFPFSLREYRIPPFSLVLYAYNAGDEIEKSMNSRTIIMFLSNHLILTNELICLIR